MKKAEIIAEIKANNFWTANNATEATSKLREDVISAGNLKLYEMSVIPKAGGNMTSPVVQPFYVYNEGEDDEEALYTIKAYADTEENTFRADLKEFLDGKISATILKYNIDKLDTDDEFAIVTVYLLEGSAVSPSTYFVYRYDGGAFSFYGYAG